MVRRQIELSKYCNSCRQEGTLCRHYRIIGEKIQCARCEEEVGEIRIDEDKVQHVEITDRRY